MPNVKFESFINAEPVVIKTDKGQQNAVMLSFGDEESEVVDRTISLQDARDIITDLINVLAFLGDPIASQLGGDLQHRIEKAEKAGLLDEEISDEEFLKELEEDEDEGF